jgi:Flp pilus assembly protein TadG
MSVIGASRWRLERPRGQALAEVALVLPIFLLILFGIVDGGRLVFSHNSLAEAARDGARWGSVQSRAATSAGRDAIADETAARLTGVPAPTVTVTCERNGAVVPGCATRDILIVRVEADVPLVTPVLGSLFGDPTLAAESRVMVNQ